MRTKRNDPFQIAADNLLHYRGDINPEYGGLFYDISNWEEHGYATALRITDLDSGCGFMGGVLIEHIIIDKPDDLTPALDCCGWDDTTEVTVHHEINVCESYGHYDHEGPQAEIITTDSESWSHDGWEATKHIGPNDLLGYIQCNYLIDLASTSKV